MSLSSSDSDNESYCFQDDLASWATDFQVKHNAVDSLLKLLQRSGRPDLPSTVRTLLHTAKPVETKVISGVEYYHFGLASEMLRNLGRYSPLQM